MLGDIDRRIIETDQGQVGDVERNKRRAVYAERRIHAECASMVHNARAEAKLTQTALAAMVGTSQSAIARFEDPDHGVRTLAMMAKIACALGYEYTHGFVRVAPKPSEKAVILASAATGARAPE